ncbi:DNA topoisomerase 3 (plasmid) [Rossellomorea sp. AcN35-11]|nr:DNA topoisomerase 3 [Rossellomorea aquimaris]WJV32237.1 DNA topoisomerase 3 [Rossellomorea sp. AcN35-11]
MYEELIIAEKPSVGSSIAKSLFKDIKRKDGYLECEGGRYAVTWAFGHLVGLAYPEAYDEKYKKWKIEDLPIIPEKHKLTRNKGASKQVSLIEKLGKDSKTVVNACDSGREGELIFHRTALTTGLYKKPIKRLWTSSVTEAAIKKAYDNLKDAKEYRNLLNSAVVRSEADWLIGINATMAFTVQVGAGDTVNIGRVKVPVVSMVYDRCKAVEDFVKKTYYVVESNFEQGDSKYKGVLEQEPFESPDRAEEIAEQVRYEHGKIVSYETEPKKVYAPKLYNLTSLTSEANRKFGYSASEVLKIAQSLYENKKCITYPRTGSNYVTPEEIPFMRNVFEVLKGSEYSSAMEKADMKFIDEKNNKICNEKYVDDHHAILPTEKVPEDLDKKESNVYNLVVMRFIAQCFPPAEYLKHVIKTEVNGHSFHTSFKELKSLGWKINDENKGKEDEEKEEEEVRTEAFSINENDSVHCTESSSVEKETSPPKLFTEGHLMTAMEVAGKSLEDEQLREAMKDSGIGTPATRASTIDGVIDAKYIKLKGKSLHVTEKGRALIDMLRQTKLSSLTSPEYTGKWEKKLNEISRGEYDHQKFLEFVKKFTALVVEEAAKQEVQVKNKVEKIADCPGCGEGIIVEGKKSFGCSRWKEGCNYKIWKNQFNKTINSKHAKSLIEKGKTDILTFTSKKKKSKYSACLIMKDLEKAVIEMEFVNKTYGPCLKCEEGKMTDRGKFMGCSSYPECDFTFSKTIKSKEIPIKQLEKLFTNNETDMIEGFVLGDKGEVSAKLYFKDGKLKMKK